MGRYVSSSSESLDFDVHRLTQEDAQRAIALSANSTIVMIGITIGTLLGGPWGAAIGAAITTPIGIFLETTLLPGEQTATIERYIYETLLNVAVAGAGPYLTKWVTQVNPTTLRSVFASINKAFGSNVSDAVIETVDVAISHSLTKCACDIILLNVF